MLGAVGVWGQRFLKFCKSGILVPAMPVNTRCALAEDLRGSWLVLRMSVASLQVYEV